MLTTRTVEDRVVVSDLEISAVKGTRVEFADGSHVDVHTGSVNLVGNGYIFVHPADTAKMTRTTKELRFGRQHLTVDSLHAKLSIEPHNGPEIEVLIEGLPQDVATIEATESSDGVLLTGGKNAPGAGIIYVKKSSGSGGTSFRATGSFVHIDEDIVISSSSPYKSDPGLVIKVLVPTRLPITVTGVTKSLSIGNTWGDLDITLDTTQDVTVGQVQNLVALIESSGELDVAEVQGVLNITSSGSADTVVGKLLGRVEASITSSGKITIREGTAESLELTGTGTADFIFKGTAKNPTITLTSSGKAVIDRMLGEIKITSTGSGNVLGDYAEGTLVSELNGSGRLEIKKGSLMSLNHSSDSGSFSFGGVSVKTNIVSTSYGKTEISEVNGPLTVRLEGSGNCIISEGSTPSIHAVLTSSGKFEFSGRSVTAHLETHGSGKIEVSHVKEQPYMKRTSSGKIRVGNWN